MQVFPILPMSHSNIKLLEGAIFLSDAHYSFKHTALLDFLKALRAQEIQTPQLILMGDVFDLLFGGISVTIERSQEAIDLINTLSDNIEILYLEGNHDFNVTSIFPGVEVFTLQQQPLVAQFKEQRVALAHGDFKGPALYRLYTALIRKSWVLKILNVVNTVGRGFIIKRLDSRLEHKKECREIAGFEALTLERLTAEYLKDFDLFIEGHFHQDSSFKVGSCLYTNLPAFACSPNYMRLTTTGLISETFVKAEV